MDPIFIVPLALAVAWAASRKKKTSSKSTPTEPPVEPGFTTDLQYSDLESVQRGELTVQELFLGGKLKMEGDYSLALQIAMQLLTNPL